MAIFRMTKTKIPFTRIRTAKQNQEMLAATLFKSPVFLLLSKNVIAITLPGFIWVQNLVPHIK
jgi:hypothetical protein